MMPIGRPDGTRHHAHTAIRGYNNEEPVFPGELTVPHPTSPSGECRVFTLVRVTRWAVRRVRAVDEETQTLTATPRTPDRKQTAQVS